MSDELDNLDAFAQTLALRYLRPQYPQLVAALEIVTGIHPEVIQRAMGSVRWTWHCEKNQNGLAFTVRGPTGELVPHWEKSPKDRVFDPREAMELFAGRGIIPEDWVGTTDRRFASGLQGVAPPTLRGAVAIAANVTAVLECERLARELFARLIPFGAAKSPKIVWRIDAEGFGGSSTISTVGASNGGVPGGAMLEGVVEAAALRTWIGASRPDRSLVSKRDPAAELFMKYATRYACYESGYVASSLRAYQSWRARAAAGGIATIMESTGVSGEEVARSRPLAELLNPFEPLLLIFSRGYAVGEVSRKAVHLIALSNFDSRYPDHAEKYYR